MESQRVGHDLATEQIKKKLKFSLRENKDEKIMGTLYSKLFGLY